MRVETEKKSQEAKLRVKYLILNKSQSTKSQIEK